MSAALEARVAALERRADEADHERVSMVDMVRRNTELTERIATDTEALRKLVADGAGAVRFMVRLGRATRFGLTHVVLPIAIIVGVIVALVHGGLPKWLAALIALLEASS